MKEVLKDAIDSEPIFKYSFFVIKWCLVIGFFALWFTVYFVWNFIFTLFDSYSDECDKDVDSILIEKIMDHNRYMEWQSK